jgi:hypothetical protein
LLSGGCGAVEGVSKVHFRKFYLIHSCCDKGEIDKFRLLRHPLQKKQGKTCEAIRAGRIEN